MRTYVVKRVLIAAVTLLGMSVLLFVLMRLAPGNITDIIFESAGYVDEADRRRLEAELGLAFSVLLGVPTGVVSAVRQDRPLDYVLRVVSLAGLSMPSFWLGMVV